VFFRLHKHRFNEDLAIGAIRADFGLRAFTHLLTVSAQAGDHVDTDTNP
jgi:hypothetical protein